MTVNLEIYRLISKKLPEIYIGMPMSSALQILLDRILELEKQLEERDQVDSMCVYSLP